MTPAKIHGTYLQCLIWTHYVWSSLSHFKVRIRYFSGSLRGKLPTPCEWFLYPYSLLKATLSMYPRSSLYRVNLIKGNWEQSYCSLVDTYIISWTFSSCQQCSQTALGSETCRSWCPRGSRTICPALWTVTDPWHSVSSDLLSTKYTGKNII